MTTIANVQANLDRSQARLDTYEVEDDAYTAYMKRQAGAWKEQEQTAPVDRVAEVLQHKLDQLQQGIRSAESTGEITGGYLAMLEVRADGVADEIDEFIKARRKAVQATNPVNDSYNARMARTANAWKDQAKPAVKKSAPAQSVKRVLIGDSQATIARDRHPEEVSANTWKSLSTRGRVVRDGEAVIASLAIMDSGEQLTREFNPVFSGDAQATLDAAFKAKQERTANAWKDGQSAPEAAAAPDLKFM